MREKGSKRMAFIFTPAFSGVKVASFGQTAQGYHHGFSETVQPSASIHQLASQLNSHTGSIVGF